MLFEFGYFCCLLKVDVLPRQISIISKPIFSPSLSQSVQMISFWHSRARLRRAFWSETIYDERHKIIWSFSNKGYCKKSFIRCFIPIIGGNTTFGRIQEILMTWYDPPHEWKACVNPGHVHLTGNNWPPSKS